MALPLDDLRKVINNKPVSDYNAWSMDMWLFSFYCNAMNMGDIYKLKYDDIKGDFIHFIRDKTKNNKKEIEPVVVYITDPIREILDRWGVPYRSPKNYIFGVYSDEMPIEEKYRVKYFTTRRINAALKRMTARLGIQTKITTYTARHTWASYLNEHNASISYISKGLGHTSLKTTENYLASFSAHKMKKMGDMITDLRNELLGDNEGSEFENVNLAAAQ